MRTENFTKAEVLHHFEVLMPKTKENKAMYISAPNFISTCTKLGLITPIGKGLYVYPNKITEQDVNNVIASLKMYNQKRNKVKNIIVQKDNLDEMAKKIAASGLYKIENGKVFKQTITWIEI